MSRWDFAWDINGDGGVTIRDVLSWAGWAFTLPGDVARDWVIKYAPGIAAFFHMEPEAWMGWYGFFWSLPVWGVVCLVWSIASDTPARPVEPPPKLY